MSAPNVSVIMPCYNHGKFVAESMASILGQTHKDLELIVVDDCSKDDSWEVITRVAAGDPRVKPIRHERNMGASRSRNDGLRAATGEFIGFCDADDIWEPAKLEFQVSLLRRSSDFDVAFCDAILVDENGRPKNQRFSELFAPPNEPSGRLFEHLIWRNFVNIQTVLMRRECLDDAGYFDEGIKWVEDWWFWIRVARHHRFIYTRDPLARYRVHSNSTALVQRRGYHVNRCKVLHRILMEYSDLPPAREAFAIYQLGVELCILGKTRIGRGLLWEAAKLALVDIRALDCLGRALWKMVRFAALPVRVGAPAAPKAP